MIRYLSLLLNRLVGKRLSTGQRGEDVAANWLSRHGMRILRRNWRHRRNEIDIIAQEDQTLVFAEVKTAEVEPEDPLALRLTRDQIRRIRQAANVFIKQNRLSGRLWRFDLVTVVLGEGDEPEITHTPHAF